MSYAHFSSLLLYFLIAAAFLSSASGELNEEVPLPFNEQINSITCPSVPVCRCDCAPAVISVTCASAPLTCSNPPNESTTSEASATSFTSNTSQGSTTVKTTIPSTWTTPLQTSTATTNPPTSTSAATPTPTSTSTTTPSTTRPTTPSTTSMASSTTTFTTISTVSSTTPPGTTATLSTNTSPTTTATPPTTASSTASEAPTSRSSVMSSVVTTGSTSMSTSSQSGTGTMTTGTSNTPITISTSGPILDNCQAILNADSGSFVSPFYPHYEYPNNANCSWLIIASSRIELWFTEFKTETSRDIVKVFDGPTTSYSRLLLHSGTNTPSSSVISYNNQVLVTFTSDSSGTNKGFNASFSLYVPPTPPPVYSCGGNVTLTLDGEHIVESPNFPSPYPNNSNCNWIISAPPGNRIEISFLNFNTTPGDYFAVYNGEIIDYNNVLIRSTSGYSNETCVYLSEVSYKVLATFRSGLRSTSYPGFRVRFSVLRGCGGYLNSSNQGMIETPGARWMKPYSYRYDCQWFVRVDAESKVNLTLDYRNTFSGNFEVYEGNKTNQLLASSWGANVQLPFTVISRANEIIVRVSTPYGCSSNDTGKLRFSYRSTTTSKYGCGGAMDLATRTVSSITGYPHNYTARSLACDWRIKEAPGTKISISFPQPIEVYPLGDKLSIWDKDTGTSSSTPIFGVSGTVHPQPIITPSNTATISFSTSGNIVNASLYQGWYATWNVLN